MKWSFSSLSLGFLAIFLNISGPNPAASMEPFMSSLVNFKGLPLPSNAAVPVFATMTILFSPYLGLTATGAPSAPITMSIVHPAIGTCSASALEIAERFALLPISVTPVASLILFAATE